MDTNTSTAKQQVLTWWILWAAFQSNVVLTYHFLTKTPQTAPQSDLPWFVGVVPFALSAVLRWAVLPKRRTPEEVFPWFLLGMALAEASSYLGIFIFRSHKQELFILSLLGVFQFVPFFTHRVEMANRDRQRADDSSV